MRMLRDLLALLAFIAAPCCAQTFPHNNGPASFSSIGNMVYVEGVAYPRTDVGVSSAISDLLAASPNGGVVILTPGAYSISNTVRVSSSNVQLVCAGGSISFNTSTGACLWNWRGSSGGIMLNFDTSNTLGIGGVAAHGITFNAASSAATALRVYSVNGGSFTDLQAFNCTGTGGSNPGCIDLGVDPSVVGSSGLNDNNVFENINVFASSVSNMTAWRMTGTANYDSSGNTFINVSGTGGTNNGDGFQLQNTDNDRWYEVNAAAHGSGFGLHLTCMPTASSQNMCSREDAFYGVNLGPSGLMQDGVGSFYATANRIYGYDLCNGSPVPSTSLVTKGSAVVDVLDCTNTYATSTYRFTTSGGNLDVWEDQTGSVPLATFYLPKFYGAGWRAGTGSDNSFSIFDAGAPNGGQQRFHALPTSSGDAETHIQSIGQSPVLINSEAHSGTGGLRVYSGGTSPVLQSASVGVQYCGATSGSTQACARTVEGAPLIIYGDLALNSASSQSITALPFTGSSTYSCSGSDLTTAAGIVSFNTYAASSVTITESGGVPTDHIRYQCVGY